MSLRICAVVCVATSLATWGQKAPGNAVPGTKQFSSRVVVSGLQNPWEITWGPDNLLWVTERTGKRITRVDPSSGATTELVRIEEASSPGGQDGLLGLAVGKDYAYLSYTYVDKAHGPHKEISDDSNPYRYLYMKVVRLSYSGDKLANPVEVIRGLPAGNDHVGGRLKMGPDGKLYLTIGDQGHNQLGNFCLPVEAQRLPTAKEIAAKDYSAYVGKSLRINPDGSIPKDNPKLKGVVSHVFTYGHRNTQGLDFAADGTLYGGEHGPKSDDEVNVLVSGGNYGWPNVAGRQDNQAYEYAHWSEAKTPCSQLKFSDLEIHPSVPREKETDFKVPFHEPIATLFTVPTGFNFSDPACRGIDFICWPTVAISSIEHYQSKGIPGWNRVLLVSTLKRGSLYVVPLAPDGKSVSGPIARYLHTENRYRDTAVSADGRTIYVATDSGGVAEALAGGVARRMHDPGAIIAFTYTGEGSGDEPAAVSAAAKQDPTASRPRPVIQDGIPPQFTAAQVTAGKTAYNTSCAVCHGSTLRNGTMGTPLAGEYFQRMWSGRSVKDLHDKAQKTMPPGAPASLSPETYANIVAFILETNGAKPGNTVLSPASTASEKMVIP